MAGNEDAFLRQEMRAFAAFHESSTANNRLLHVQPCYCLLGMLFLSRLVHLLSVELELAVWVGEAVTVSGWQIGSIKDFDTESACKIGRASCRERV